MPSRYYFLSSLPMLRFNDKAPISWDEFLNQAKGNISESDFHTLCSLETESNYKNSFLKKWVCLNDKVNGAINSLRAAKLGRPNTEGVVFRDLEIEQISNAAINAKNPLEAELLIMKFLYDFLEQEKGYNPFSETSLLCYALQLRILQRKQLFNIKSGNEQYDKLFGIIQKELKME